MNRRSTDTVLYTYRDAYYVSTHFLCPALRVNQPGSPARGTTGSTKRDSGLPQVRKHKNGLTVIEIVHFTGDGATSRRRSGVCREGRWGWEERADLQTREKKMARFLGKQEDGEAGRFPVPRKEIAPPSTADLPQVRVGVDFVGAFERLVAVLASRRRAPASCVAQAKLGRDDLAHGGVGGIRVGWKL